MLFNSVEFFVFLPIVFAVYWLIPNKKISLQNSIILLASYIFYGWWDWRFLLLIVFSSTVDFLVGKTLIQTKDATHRKLLLWTSIVTNLGLLMFFKYCNFFLDSFVDSFTFFGGQMEVSRLNIILPVGISFYTFQTMSYTIDIYYKITKPTTNALAFFSYVSFFPQLVAGPIERAKDLLPQFLKERSFDVEKAKDGMRQALWGFFKKLVIADNCAIIVNDLYLSPDAYNGSTLFIGLFLFSLQLYCDFSGYSDIAIGTARLLGFNLSLNFNYPRFANSVPDFWRRWHITLTSWFRDYLFIPMFGGRRRGNAIKIRNTIILLAVIGLWHGPSWTYLIYGVINGLFFIPSIVGKKGNNYIFNPTFKSERLKKYYNYYLIFQTIIIVDLLAVIFRAPDMATIQTYYSSLFTFSLFEVPNYGFKQIDILSFITLVVFLIVEWFANIKQKPHPLDFSDVKLSSIQRFSLYNLLIFLILLIKAKPLDFIYFEF